MSLFSETENDQLCCFRSFKPGYHGGPGEGGRALLERTMEALRQEAERRDYYGGTVLLHSLGGGTGSGEQKNQVQVFLS